MRSRRLSVELSSHIVDHHRRFSLGARGASLVFSSGDVGVGDGNPDPATQTCFTNDGQNRTRFIPMFPASCPLLVHVFCIAYVFAVDAFGTMHSVTAVGGTLSIPEVAAPFSGGGFSDIVSFRSFRSNVTVIRMGKILVPAPVVSRRRRAKVSSNTAQRHLRGTLQSSWTRAQATIFLSAASGDLIPLDAQPFHFRRRSRTSRRKRKTSVSSSKDTQCLSVARRRQPPRSPGSSLC